MDAITPQITFGFEFRELTQWYKPKTICIPNLAKICQFSAELKLLPVWKTHGRHIGFLLADSILTNPLSSACHSVSVFQIVGQVMQSSVAVLHLTLYPHVGSGA